MKRWCKLELIIKIVRINNNAIGIPNTYPRLIVMRIGPVPMKFDYVRMLQLREALEDDLYLLLLGFKVFPLGELHLVPHHLDALLRVHG